MVLPVHDEDDLETGFRPWVVWLLVVLNIGIFLYMLLLPDVAVQLIAFSFGVVPAFITHSINPDGATFLIPPVLTLMTYMFLHGNWIHLAANMLFLWVFGDNVEAATGHWRFILFFGLSGIAGGMAHIVSDQSSTTPLIGASAAIAGIVAGYLLLRPCARVTLLILGIVTVTVRAYWILGIWLAWQVANVMVPAAATGTAYWSHIGGFAAGLVLILLFRRPGVTVFECFGR